MNLPESALAPLPLPTPALYVLIGAAGSGKTHIATAFPRDWRLSLDACRQRISDAGDQAATPDAVTLFDAALNGRLARRRPTVVDATSTNLADRAHLVKYAHQHQLPAVAIAARTPLALCLARQAPRPTNRQVPEHVVTEQHAGVPTTEQLLKEGFDQVHDATDLDLLRLLLERSAAAGPNALAAVRAAFGDDLARVFAFDAGDRSRGAFVVAGRQLAVRWWDEAEPYEAHWEARLDGTCPGCGDGTLWVEVTSARDLLDVYNGGQPDEPVCDVCDAL
ncbi:AAA family ATPase [Streptomyces palmae]|nr:AAA family ATPase [Streptomyces palmae]